MSGPEPIDPYANLTTLPAVTAGSEAEGTYTVDIRMSGHETRQHVGQLNGQRMWQTIHNCLMDICPYERGSIGCYDEMPSAGFDKPGKSRTHRFQSKCRIEDVPYVTSKGSYATNAHIDIWATGIYRDKKYPGLGEATVSTCTAYSISHLLTLIQYEMAAGIFKAVTENKANCYNTGYDNTRSYRFCNVPQHVLVAFPTTGPVTEAWLSVWVKFNGDTTDGTLDCSGTNAGVTDFWETAVRPDVAKILGYPENQWGTRTTCENDEKCFDVKTWRNCK